MRTILDQCMYACLTGLQMRQKSVGTVSLSQKQWTLGQCRVLLEPCDLHALFSVVTVVILLVVIVSVIGTDVIISGNPIFFLNIFP